MKDMHLTFKQIRTDGADVGQVPTFNGDTTVWSNPAVRVYTSSGLVQDHKVWIGQTQSNSDGVWDFDISSADFTEILSIQISSHTTETTISDATLTAISGLGGGDTSTVYITVYGY